MKNVKVEICLDSVESAIIAEKNGADRVELCDNLFEGGTTPSYGTIKMARSSVKLGLQVIIRPRGGDFCYSDLEFEVMRADIEMCKSLGVDGVVLGILNPDGSVDINRTKQLVELASPLNVTFHRAFDMTNDPFKALENVISTGADRLLTSGQEASVIEGIPLIKDLIEKAGEKIIVMPGAGLTKRNLTYFLNATNASEIHLAAQEFQEGKMNYRPSHIFMGGYLHLPEFQLARSSGKIIKSICQGE